MHSGPYSVPGVGSEWFWVFSNKPNSSAARFMDEYFPPKFTYQDFGPKFTMEFFNAKKMADIIADSGAKQAS